MGRESWEGGIEPASDTVGDDGTFTFVRERRPEAGDGNDDVGESGGTMSVMMFVDGILLLSSPGD